MAKFRIVEETYVNGKKVYVVQRKHWLFRWIWCSASLSEVDYVYAPSDRSDTIEEAKKMKAVYENMHSPIVKTTVIDDN